MRCPFSPHILGENHYPFRADSDPCLFKYKECTSLAFAWRPPNRQSGYGAMREKTAKCTRKGENFDKTEYKSTERCPQDQMGPTSRLPPVGLRESEGGESLLWHCFVPQWTHGPTPFAWESVAGGLASLQRRREERPVCHSFFTRSLRGIEEKGPSL